MDEKLELLINRLRISTKETHAIARNRTPRMTVKATSGIMKKNFLSTLHQKIAKTGITLCSLTEL